MEAIQGFFSQVEEAAQGKSNGIFAKGEEKT
jgi:hypothetical protein